MNRDSNAYTFGFAAVMVIVVASVLAFAATSLQDLQAENVRKEKMQNILATIGIEIDREAAEGKFNEYIVSQLSLRKDGSIDPQVDAFSDIKLAIEVKKEVDEQRFPILRCQRRK
jgi:Na+-transporting NADH:ubiquinone oxidoreductase subunit C